MIYFDLSIRNPWARDCKSVNYFIREERLTKNKSYCIQISRMSLYNLIKFNINLAWAGCDHAGPELILEVWGYMLMLQLYDNRHWNYDEGRWETTEDRERERAEWDNA